MPLTTYESKKAAVKAYRHAAGALPGDIEVRRVQYLKENNRFKVIVTLDADPDPKIDGIFQGFSVKYDKKERIVKRITIRPFDTAYAAKAGTMHAKVIDALFKGVTFQELRKVCSKKDGSPWTDASIKSFLYWDINQKGYGIEARENDGIVRFHLVLPEGLTEPVPHFKKEYK